MRMAMKEARLWIVQVGIPLVVLAAYVSTTPLWDKIASKLKRKEKE